MPQIHAVTQRFDAAATFTALCQGTAELGALSGADRQALALWILSRNIAEGALDADEVIEEEVRMVLRARM